jgi:NADH-quinone oxidoreductase subunit M
VSVLSLVVFLPLAAAAVLVAVPRLPDAAARWAWVAVTAVDLVLVVGLWLAYPGSSSEPSGVIGGIAFETDVRWIPSVDAGYHVGVDGLSLPLLGLTAGLFLACAVYSLREARSPRLYAALFLFLQTTCLGVFAALDLLLFFVFFDLSIVGMYFVIAGWGHGESAGRSALRFFLYTFLGSLALLLGILGLFVAAEPHTFDMVELARAAPLADDPMAGSLVLLALAVGLAVKIPTVPFHTWLPPAHTDAPAAGSAVLAGVLLKLGTYGLVRIALPILPEAWQRWAGVAVAVGVVSVLYGALVALAQTDFKRMVAYTSVNHMGYVVLGLGVAGLVADSAGEARSLAVTGAVTQMVSHGLLTGSLFLLAGVLHDRGGTYDMAAYGGLAARMPAFAALTALAAFGSLGLPGFSGFVAEFQVFTGAVAVEPVAAVALLGILVTAALFLLALHRVFLGPPAGVTVADAPGTPATPGRHGPLPDLQPREWVAIAPLLLLSVVIGVFPAFLLDVIEPAAVAVVELVSR